MPVKPFTERWRRLGAKRVNAVPRAGLSSTRNSEGNADATFCLISDTEGIHLHIGGSLCTSSIPQLLPMLARVKLELDRSKRPVVLDLGRLVHVDAAGVGILRVLRELVHAAASSCSTTGLTGQPRYVLRCLRLGDRSGPSSHIDPSHSRTRHPTTSIGYGP